MKKIIILVAILFLLTGASLAITVDLKICDGRGTEGIIWYNPTTETPGEDLAPVNGATVRVFEDSDLTRYRDFLTDSNGSCVFMAEIADSVNIWKTNYNLYGLTVSDLPPLAVPL